MEIKKLQMLGVVFAAMMLAACSSTDTEEGGEVDSGQSLSGFDGSANVQPAKSQAEIDREEAMKNLQTVFYFEFDSSTLTAEARRNLDAQISFLKDSVGTIRLEGHADERGTREYNIALGERRAQAVADYMVLNGISRYRIETVSYGEERPVAFGQGESAWSQNRRVELK
ncbi:peptidoglycan-associated lipoprotein [Litorivivens lipolytica]|uniref:Peptidoglycan-associated lipoprotein n=1 Tax=Litorivivens lipolytica TaxID=1524264 RepID=A0A7W4Z5R5_9GAMM|nr:peptidoglycan-associated lipoprotein Pal [Litorivivens lipolytica]MBB3047372.1 peptidoglycan-associated lipoprotein [Litorivivens lipolytica]